jgi:N-ethylmaleimide reductase
MSLANRIVMAPMTRSRAASGDLSSDLHVEYYGQRAGAGLIITEGTQPSQNGKGYCRTPGIYNAEQVAAWAQVTKAVHGKGGKIVLQIMHCGRVASHLNKDADTETIAPSAITARGKIYTEEGMRPLDPPRAMTREEIPVVIEEYRQATENAYLAGFDGVELHCTSGYLPAQFLSSGSNQRNDEYGGNVVNRVRFAIEVLEAMSSVDGADRVGMRICPDNPFNDLYDEDPEQTFSELLSRADALGLAYLHVIRFPTGRVDNLALARRCFSGAIIANDSYERSEAEAAIMAGEADMVSFGRAFIANPDLPDRFRTGADLAEFDMRTLYAAGPEGYTDYPLALDDDRGSVSE